MKFLKIIFCVVAFACLAFSTISCQDKDSGKKAILILNKADLSKNTNASAKEYLNWRDKNIFPQYGMISALQNTGMSSLLNKLLLSAPRVKEGDIDPDDLENLEVDYGEGLSAEDAIERYKK